MAKTIAVVGAGTMGSGIALSAALGKYQVILCDINPDVMTTAKLSIQKNLHYLLKKEKISKDEMDATLAAFTFTNQIETCIADVVIEAVVEKLEVKIDLFKKLAAVNRADAILATNTSSLSVTAIQAAIDHPGRVAGLHFFNPAHIMKLVEIVKGKYTAAVTIQHLQELCNNLGKTPVVCSDSPGFIVNRVARPFYLEALHLAENKVASFEAIDKAVTAAGFKMGPFELMDLIGMDINYAVSASLYEAYHQAPGSGLHPFKKKK